MDSITAFSITTIKKPTRTRAATRGVQGGCVGEVAVF
jgi:hypothetical protein